MRIIRTDADIEEGMAHLGKADPRLARVAAIAGPIPLRRHVPGLAGLCSIIVSQQLSVASADAIWRKTKAGLGEITAEAILGADEATLRAFGLSTPKMRTLRGLAEAVRSGTLPVDALCDMPGEEAMTALTSVPGIGPWTAEIYLMFYAGHADVFAAGDLALQEAARLALGFDARPSARELAVLAEGWRPWRAVAARLLWAFYRVAKARDGITGGG
ncbi:MAG TPA: DNA-3-methyladenine glycosylase 2 family protein [Beijerinckiaceae bacterium]|nr:DNA-3-methyladenine glycosylase 2 family protein [Beijerinckiaceae bacterium]